ncbi:MAG: SRPBCC family protein [Gammaproteobacteria bacterium]|nr:SRPBCC family protein [Gammaproteobacteria bacterium]
MRKLAYSVLVLVALLVLIGFALPSSHRVAVSTEIDAHAATIFAQINDFRRYALWAPGLDGDPNARVLYSGSNTGVGAIMTWDGPLIGSGTQTIVDSQPFEYVGMLMNGGEPGEARARFDLTPGTGTTIVTWQLEVDYGLNIVGRYFAPMFGRVVARENQVGLEKLKELAESLPTADFSDLQIEQIMVEPEQIAFIRTTSLPQSAEIAGAMRAAYFNILTFMHEHGLEEAGPPLSITRMYSGSSLVFDAAIPVRGLTESTPRDGGDVQLGSTYEGSVIRVSHKGSYRLLARTHRKIAAYLTAHGLKRNGDAWEAYISDPSFVPEDELLTFVYYPIRIE